MPTGDLARRVGRNVRALRTARGLSQEAFAEVAGVHRTYAGRIERGQQNMSLAALERLAAVLDVDPAVLLDPGLEVRVSVEVRPGGGG